MTGEGVAPADSRRPDLDLDRYVEGIRTGDRGVLARAITLVESGRPESVALAQELLTRIQPATGHAYRVGISGVPGVGKSTFIDAFGCLLVERGHRVAVLAVDPSSSLSGGSILGDKSRMPNLARSDAAFIRPSASAQSLGGVARRTREAILVCEAAGFDVILVETVGVGQSETMVADMVDFFLVLALPGAGDELQGIKRGILELADTIAVNKCDGDNVERARAAQSVYRSALSYLRPRSSAWRPEAVTISAIEGKGLGELWELVLEHRLKLTETGDLARIRRDQRRRWLWSLLEDGLLATFRQDARVRSMLPRVEAAVEVGEVTPAKAAEELLGAFTGDAGQSSPDRVDSPEADRIRS